MKAPKETTGEEACRPLRVLLEDAEYIVPHGAKETVWFVRVRDAWVAARAVEGATVSAIDAGPGVVWRQSIELSLLPGARFMRVDSAPQVERRTPLEYLARGPASGRSVRRSLFRLNRSGSLEKWEPGPNRTNRAPRKPREEP
jgi:hypothetical protein